MIETLLAPVRADAPCGDDLSFAPEFDAIAERRREDDATLDQSDWVAPLKAADWPGVVPACEALLTGRTKDLRLAVWWAEAATQVRGFAGLRDGLALASGLCERYWDTLHPLIDDGDAEQRVGNLAWLLARLPDWGAQVALCDGAQGRFSQRGPGAAGRSEPAAGGARGRGAGALDADPESAARRLPAWAARQHPAAPQVRARTPMRARPRRRPAPSRRAPRRCGACARWPSSFTAPSRTARSPTSPTRRRAGASCRCTCGCARWSRTRARWRISTSCSASSRRRRRKNDTGPTA